MTRLAPIFLLITLAVSSPTAPATFNSQHSAAAEPAMMLSASATHWAAKKICGETRLVRELAKLVKVARVAPPQLRVDATVSRSYYLPLTKTMVTGNCESSNALAHELGHHITVLAAEANGVSLEDEVRVFSTIPSWIKQSADEAGFERSAHCVAYVLGARGSYTKCPQRVGRDAARAIIQTARIRSAQQA